MIDFAKTRFSNSSRTYKVLPPKSESKPRPVVPSTSKVLNNPAKPFTSKRIRFI